MDECVINCVSLIIDQFLCEWVLIKLFCVKSIDVSVDVFTCCWVTDWFIITCIYIMSTVALHKEELNWKGKKLLHLDLIHMKSHLQVICTWNVCRVRGSWIAELACSSMWCRRTPTSPVPVCPRLRATPSCSPVIRQVWESGSSTSPWSCWRASCTLSGSCWTIRVGFSPNGEVLLVSFGSPALRNPCNQSILN